MNCRQCGNKIPDGYLRMERFRCPSCGKVYVRKPAPDAVRRKVAHPINRYRKKKPLPLNKKLIFAGGGVLFLILVIVLIVWGKSSGDANKQSVPTPTAFSTITPVPTASPLTTYTSVADFTNRFEAAMEQLGYPCEIIIDEGIGENGHGIFYIDNTNLIAMNYTEVKGTITELTLIGTGDGTTDSGLRIFASIGSAMCGIDGTTKMSDTGQIIINTLDGYTYYGENYVMKGSTSNVVGTIVTFTGTQAFQ